MSTISGTSGTHPIYSSISSPRNMSGSPTPSHRIGGETLTSIHQLSVSQREQFLNTHDPMRKLRINNDTPLYRTTEKRFIQEGKLAGNPKSIARVNLHEELQLNPLASILGDLPHEASAYFPKSARAADLKDPSLNVMTGSRAKNAIRGYAHDDHVAVKMRLGDFLEKGGKVYADTSSVIDGGDEASALIVTLPKGQKVPVEIIPTPNDNSNKGRG